MNNPIHNRKRVFISGPMRGKPLFNFPAFDAARDLIEAAGHFAVSPADIDRAHGFDAATLPAGWDWNIIPSGLDMRAVMLRDIEALAQCDAIFLLPGWEESVGARAEVAFAAAVGIHGITI